jgi:hypothetical protein
MVALLMPLGEGNNEAKIWITCKDKCLWNCDPREAALKRSDCAASAQSNARPTIICEDYEQETMKGAISIIKNRQDVCAACAHIN